MNILIIGSEGFIGRTLTDLLIKASHTITGFDLKQGEHSKGKYVFISGDIMDKSGLEKAMEGIECVINLAAKHHDFGISREGFFEINEKGTDNILQAMVNKQIKKLVFFSSVAVYGEVKGCSSEATPVNPANDYGESKLAAERLIGKWYTEDNSRQALIIRPAVVFGPYNYANMYKLIDTIYKRRYISVGKGDNIKSACYVENLAAACVFLIARMQAGVAVYNYSDYEHLKSNDFINIIYACLGRQRSGIRIPLAPVLVVTSVIDLLARITKINFHITSNRIKKFNAQTWHGSDKVREEGFTPEVTLKEGLSRMVEWYLKDNK